MHTLIHEYHTNQYSLYTLPDGFDDETLADELLVEDLSENQLIDFIDDLDDFPYDPKDPPSTDDAKRAFIFDLIYKLSVNPNLHFGVNMPKC